MQHLWEWADANADRRPRRAGRSCRPADEWEQLDADADDCVGEFCSHFRDCFFFKKRDEAKYADLVVVNHALFFLDLAVGGGLLPPYDVAVLDEAHQCERWATDALTVDALARDDRPHAAQAASRLRRCRGRSMREFDEGVRGLESALARVPGDRYPLAANDDAWPALERAARRRCIVSRTGCSPTGIPR